MSTINSSRDSVMGSMSTEAYEELTTIRENTMVDREFIHWMSSLNVSRSYEDPTGKIRAKDIMSSWDTKRFTAIQL